MTSNELYASFLTFVENNDEAGARTFLADHISEFPQEIQEKIAFAFFTEALVAKGGEIQAKATILEEGKKILQGLDEAESVLTDAQAAATIKEDIQNPQ